MQEVEQTSHMTDNSPEKQVAFSLSTDFTNGYDIPTYNGYTRLWEYTTFYSFKEFKEFISSCIKEPGEYDFDEEYLIVQQQARHWTEKGYYCNASRGTKDFTTYWDTESEKCRKGIIVKGSTGKVWYLTRDYYMWINFLPIFHKEKRKTLFPDLYDGQHHIAICEFEAELNGQHFVMLKKRQYAQSYQHMAKLINQIWFEKNITLKLLSYLSSYIGIEGDWSFLNEYRDFLNDNTAWYRPFDPDKTGSWQQRYEYKSDGRTSYKGRKGRLMGITTKDNATKGVGGASLYIMVEEAGINPTMDTTYGYAKAALEAGALVTVGQFIAFGSVGDLKQCEPLRKYMMYPEDNGFYARETRFYDKNEGPKKTGFFVPEVWNMLGFTDKYGNSDVEGAIKYLEEVDRPAKKNSLTPEDYQLEISQHPIYITEAFAIRGTPIFPSNLVSAQKKKIEEKTYPVEYVDLQSDMQTGKIKPVATRKLPILEFPVPLKMEDKTGAICIYERPIAGADWETYYASIDPISEGKSISSDSLCSIIVYRNDLELTITDSEGVSKTEFKPGQIVCTWTGRFDDINDTHQRLENIIEYYNAYTLVEANISLFIQYMISKRKQKYLVPKDQIPFLKEIKSNTNTHQEYGWKNTGTMFKSHLLSWGVEFTKRKLDVEFDEFGNEVKVLKYGIERIPDPMIIEEMAQYQHGTNADRIVAYCALVAFIEIRNNNFQTQRQARINNSLETKQNNSKLYKKSSPFNNFGNGSSYIKKYTRSGFKNYK